MWISFRMNGTKMLRQLFWTGVFLGGLALSYNYGKDSVKNEDIQIQQFGGQTYLHWNAMDKTYPLYHFGEDLFMGSRDHQLKGANYVLRATIANKLAPERSPIPQHKGKTVKEKVVDEYYNFKERAQDIKEEFWGN